MRLTLSTIIAGLLLMCVLLPQGTEAADQTKRILDCKLDAKTIDDCNTNEYVNRLIAFVIPGAVCAVLLFIVCPFFYCFRCCGCCGAGTPSRPVSSADVCRSKIYTWVVLLLVVILALWGNISSGIFVNGLLGLADDAEGIPKVLGGHLDKIQSNLAVTLYNTTTDKDYTKNLFEGTDLNATGHKVLDDMEKSIKDGLKDFRGYVNQFSFVMFLVFSIPVGIVLLAGLTSMCNIRTCLPGIIGALFFEFGFILYLCYGVFGAIGLAVGDICAEVRAMAADQQSILPAIAGCDDALFTEFLDNFGSIEIDISTSACNEIKKLCYDNNDTFIGNAEKGTIYDCGKGLTCSNVRFSDVVVILDTTAVHANISLVPNAKESGVICTDTSATTPCTIAHCADTCKHANGSRTTTGILAKATYSTFLAASQVSVTIDTLGGIYGSCTSLLNIIFVPFDYSCKLAASGSLTMHEAFGYGGMMSIAVIVSMVIGGTKFMSFKEAAMTRQESYLQGDSENAPASQPQ